MRSRCPCLRRKFLSSSLLAGLVLALGLAAAAAAGEVVTYATGQYVLRGMLCKPEAAGPFPAVVYNHGGDVIRNRGRTTVLIGGSPDETCAALAKAGFVGFSPIRRPTDVTSPGHLDDVLAAVDYVAALPYVDRGRLGIMGFSSGGMMTYRAAVKRGGFKAVIIMAPSRGIDGDSSAIGAPILLLVAKNDTGSDKTKGHDTLALMQSLAAQWKQADRDVSYIEYPPYGNDGHTMFFEVGSYWPDVVNFLKAHL